MMYLNEEYHPRTYLQLQTSPYTYQLLQYTDKRIMGLYRLTLY